MELTNEKEDFQEDEILYEIKHKFLGSKKSFILILTPDFVGAPKTMLKWFQYCERKGVFVFESDLEMLKFFKEGSCEGNGKIMGVLRDMKKNKEKNFWVST